MTMSTTSDWPDGQELQQMMSQLAQLGAELGKRIKDSPLIIQSNTELGESDFEGLVFVQRPGSHDCVEQRLLLSLIMDTVIRSTFFGSLVSAMHMDPNEGKGGA